jgi:cytochrome c oxidase subunit 1
MAEAAALLPAATILPRVRTDAASAQRVTYLYVGTSIALFLVMGLAGLAMRSSQAGIIALTPDQFYMLLTLHGTGMIVTGLVGMMGAIWFVVQEELQLDRTTMYIAYAVAVAGVVCVLVSTVFGGFGASWTFLYPLPFFGWWPSWATTLYLLGDLLVGAAFALFCSSILVHAVKIHGGLGNALALPVLLGRASGHGATGDGSEPAPSIPSPASLVATVTSIQGIIAVGGGTIVLLAVLEQVADSTLSFNALWAKNITYFFGHTVANLTIYIAAGMLYAILPRYAGRTWAISRPLVIAWMAVLIAVLTAYFHHIYLDFAQPVVLDVAGEVITDTAVTAALVMTIFGALLIVWRSAFRWTLASLLLYAGFSGWLIGGLAALLDSIIPFNFHLHNTLWVPGHFHTYYLVGIILFMFGFLTYMLEQASGTQTPVRTRAIAVGAMLIGGYGLVGSWLLAGLLGVPRRYAVQPYPGPALSVIAVVAVLILCVGIVVVLGEWVRLITIARHARSAERSDVYGVRR